jgi:hypothetical protein
MPIVWQKSAERTRGAMFVLARAALLIFLAMLTLPPNQCFALRSLRDFYNSICQRQVINGRRRARGSRVVAQGPSNRRCCGYRAPARSHFSSKFSSVPSPSRGDCPDN